MGRLGFCRADCLGGSADPRVDHSPVSASIISRTRTVIHPAKLLASSNAHRARLGLGARNLALVALATLVDKSDSCFGARVLTCINVVREAEPLRMDVQPSPQFRLRQSR